MNLKRADQTQANAVPRPAENVRDALLLLDHGPLHLRLRVNVSQVPLKTAREAYVDRLFQTLDADGNGKIFGEELDRYVLARAEPAATTARVNLYDTGRGFFETLDRNGDGRLSMRERMLAAASLRSLTAQNNDPLGPDDPARHFHLEFVRGSFALFGPTDQMLAPTSPSFEQRTPVGPIWFQRMDRNNDGDLTWNEFLGPREAFLSIDQDHDGLIDPQEASAATAGSSDS